MTDSPQNHATPQPNAQYRHTNTDELVEYLHRKEDAYYFSINGGERTLGMYVEDWHTYRDNLVLEGYQ